MLLISYIKQGKFFLKNFCELFVLSMGRDVSCGNMHIEPVQSSYRMLPTCISDTKLQDDSPYKDSHTLYGTSRA